jgi:hypothetical protein
MPIHRIDKSSKTPVFAYKDELDNWIQKRENEIKSSPTKIKFYNRPYFFLPLILFCLVLIYLIFFWKTKDTQPADFKILYSELITFNKNGEELWRYNTEIENLVEEKAYRDHFQFKRKNSEKREHDLPHLIVKDINNDKKNEVLFSTQTQDGYGEGVLLCFDYDKSLLWKFETGRELKFGSKIYSQDYRIRGFEVSDLDNDGHLEIIIIAIHKPYFPTQIIVLNNVGHRLGEYWNSGHLSDLTIIDLDDDGTKEIIVSGQNNQYGKGCVIVFDLRQIEGCSPNSGYYRCEELRPGTEKYYLLFPRTDVDVLFNSGESIALLNILRNRRISVLANLSSIYFELNVGLGLEDARLSNAFRKNHHEAFLEGKIDGPLDEIKYTQNLAQDLLYYDGQNWVSTPTMTSYWKNKLANNQGARFYP